MENGTRFFYKLMLLFNSKIRKYEGKFSQIYIIRENTNKVNTGFLRFLYNYFIY